MVSANSILDAFFSNTAYVMQKIVPLKSQAVETREIITMQATPIWKLVAETGPFVRLGGLVGASAVVLGAYGAHKTYPQQSVGDKADLRRIFETANRFHFLHSLALVSVPLCRYPYVSGGLFLSGMLLFCGTCYYHAFTGERIYNKLTPIGGSLLILGWLAMVL